jgi:ferrous iron transport protein A
VKRDYLKTVAEMETDESAVISGFTDEIIANKLLEMGFLPGIAIRFNFSAPLGDPICVTVSGFDLSLRLDEARAITILN